MLIQIHKVNILIINYVHFNNKEGHKAKKITLCVIQVNPPSYFR